MHIGFYGAKFGGYEAKRFRSVAKEMGHRLTTVAAQSLIVSIERDGSITVQAGERSSREMVGLAKKAGLEIDFADAETDLASFDAVIARVFSLGSDNRSFYPLLVAQFYRQCGVTFLNSKVIAAEATNKIQQYSMLAAAGLPIVPTRLVADLKQLKEATGNLEFPLFVKPHAGSRGEGASAPKNALSLRKAYVNSPQSPHLLIQDNLGTRSDIRVIVVGGQALGAIRRTATKLSDITNASAGGLVERCELTNEIATLAESVCKVMGSDFGGVDLMSDRDEKLHVLEHNSIAHFKAFESVCDIDVPKAVFSWLESANSERGAT